MPLEPVSLQGSAAERKRRATLENIRRMECSVTLADPSLPDCPLIGCSEGFERITGYPKKEVVGRNCRFLNSGCIMKPEMRTALRTAATVGGDFIGVLPNRRKNGEFFDNFLLMTSVHVAGHRYVLGIQADVTHAGMNLEDSKQVDEAMGVVQRALSKNVQPWVRMQEQEFQRRLPIPRSEAQIQLRAEAGQALCCKNTFLHVPEEVDEEALSLRRSHSDSILDRSSSARTFKAWAERETGSTASSEGRKSLSTGSSAKTGPRSSQETDPTMAYAGRKSGGVMLDLHWVQEQGKRATSPLTFLVGQQAQLTARVGTGSLGPAERKALLPGLRYFVDPPLPPGLALNRRTGTLYGAPEEAQDQAEYVVSVTTEASGPGGMSLGSVVLLEAKLSILIVELTARYRICDYMKEVDEDGNEQLILTYEAAY